MTPHTPAPAERLGFTEFCYVHCDKHECCTNECERSGYEAARKAREEAQQRIDAAIKELEHLRDGQYNDIVGHNVRYAYDYAIILLRSTQQQAGDGDE